MATINPYITFNGNCEEAFNFYKSIFGGDFTHMERYKNTPNVEQVPKCEGEKILHISLPINSHTILMGSDNCCDADSEFDSEVHFGNNISLSISTKSEEETTKLFEALSKEGRISMPLQKTFWDAYYGMLIDKYGINWMVSYEYPKK
ncbi:VOC family protein [uncultured Acetobacteroides sp.]|uniref:VOC family protein n=1 Tax=uncultured Acetobacteroides sp. TaxID=1760811 RepID=UPI0029F4CCD3|nr:VOC family protein [uncultured Acetobacteroides sp.]